MSENSDATPMRYWIWNAIVDAAAKNAKRLNAEGTMVEEKNAVRDGQLG